VRGTVRSQRKADQIRQKYPEADLRVVEDMQVDGASDDVLDGNPRLNNPDVGVDAICHVASPFHFKPKDNEKDLLLPAIQGTLNILKSALKVSSIKRIVITSTMATISNIGRGAWPGKVYTVSPLPRC